MGKKYVIPGFIFQQEIPWTGSTMHGPGGALMSTVDCGQGVLGTVEHQASQWRPERKRAMRQSCSGANFMSKHIK
jgi:hypothetical protein